MKINSLSNKKVVELAKLRQKKYRNLSSSYLVYGDNIICEAIKKNKVSLFITTDDFYDADNVLYVTEDVMKKIINVEPIPGLVAKVKMQEEREFNSNKVLVIDEVQDPGNLGTILRTSLALGVDNIFIGNDSVDLYNEKTVRAMQGVIFHLNIRFGDVYEYLSTSKNQIVTSFLDEDNQVNTKLESFNFVVGNEGRGISKKIKELDHINKKIDIKFESLNVSIATALILNEIV